MAKNLLIEEYPLAENDINWDGEKWILDTMVAGMEGIGRFVIGLAKEVHIIESEELKNYIKDYTDQYLSIYR
jgi:hypothetical protein